MTFHNVAMVISLIGLIVGGAAGLLYGVICLIENLGAIKGWLTHSCRWYRGGHCTHRLEYFTKNEKCKHGHELVFDCVGLRCCKCEKEWDEQEIF